MVGGLFVAIRAYEAVSVVGLVEIVEIYYACPGWRHQRRPVLMTVMQFLRQSPPSFMGAGKLENGM